MRKMKNLVLLSISLFVAFVFAACSADSEDGMGANGMNEFSAEELQQIYQMKEDYGVSFDFPKKSDKPLPSMKEFEELCKFVASMNSSKTTIERKGNTIVGSAKPLMRTRAFSIGKEVTKPNKKTYSGYHSSSGSLSGDGYSCSFDYEVKWSNVKSNGDGDVTGNVKSINSPNGWWISDDGFSYNVREFMLCYTFYFSATTAHGYVVDHLSYSSEVSMAVQG